MFLTMETSPHDGFVFSRIISVFFCHSLTRSNLSSVENLRHRFIIYFTVYSLDFSLGIQMTLHKILFSNLFQFYTILQKMRDENRTLVFCIHSNLIFVTLNVYKLLSRRRTSVVLIFSFFHFFQLYFLQVILNIQ